jgi:Glycosyl hydrolases family 43
MADRVRRGRENSDAGPVRRSGALGHHTGRVLLAFAALVPAVALFAAVREASAATWQPDVAQDFPDPSVLYADGSYYAYSTEVGVDNVPFTTSTDGVHWSTDYGDALPQLPSWATFGSTWSPTVAKDAAGNYVMFYATHDAHTGTQCIGEAVARSPSGPFVDSNPGPVVCDAPEGGDIDPDIFTDPSDGRSYLIWKLNANVRGHAASLWSVPLSADFSIDGTATEILAAGQPWQDGVVEGPDMFEDGGSLYLFYGGNNYDTSNYAIGYAICETPTGPCHEGEQNPVLTTAGQMIGPGGPSVFETPHGLEMAFAAWAGTVGYENGGYRPMYTASVAIEDGIPRFDPLYLDVSESSYWVMGESGSVYAFDAPSFISHPVSGVVAAAADPAGNGYWTVTSDGSVNAYGAAPYLGGANIYRLARPVVGMVATPDGRGYWLVASDGGVFSFGDAAFHGSMGGRPLNRPVVGITGDPVTGGYWLVASDGGIFSFDAPFYGSTGDIRLAKPVVAAVATPDGGGYWMAAADGGVFSFGDAGFAGSLGGLKLNKPIVGMAVAPDGTGYWLVGSDGGIFTFGEAGFAGSARYESGTEPVVAMAADAVDRNG